MRMSKSKLLTYRSCPLKFRLNYIEHFEEPRGNTWAADFGNSIHDEIEHFYDRSVKIEPVKFMNTETDKIETQDDVIINWEKYEGKGRWKQHMRNFVEFKQQILAKIKENKKDLKYFFPKIQEIL